MPVVNTYLNKAILAELSYVDLHKDLTATQYVARLQGLEDLATDKNRKVA